MNQTPANHSAENESPPQAAPARIVVAIDTSRQSLAALEEAATLAALMQAELEGLFIEDINLLHLCGFPFSNQIGSYTAQVRRMDNRDLERELRVLAARLRQETERIARRAQVPWRFQVRRGAVVAELLNAARSAMFLSLGRASSARRRTLGSTAQAVLAQATQPVLLWGEKVRTQPPLVLIYTGDETSRRALELAIRLAPRYNHQLQIWLQPQADETETQLRAELDTRSQTYADQHDTELAVEIVTFSAPSQLAAKLQSGETLLGGPSAQHAVILPGSQADLLAYHPGPTLVVP